MPSRRLNQILLSIAAGGIATWAYAAEPTGSAAAVPASHPVFSQLDLAEQKWSVLEKYCFECHNAEDWAGGLALDTLSPETVPEDAEVWEKLISRMRGGLMPPPGEPRPDNETLYSFVDWMESYLDHVAQQQPNPGNVALHRLNRKEYANAVRYLLDLEVDAATLLPQDDVSDGFDNIASVLQVSPSFLDQYLAAARMVAVQAVGNPAARPAGTPYVAPPGDKQQTHVEGLPLGTRGGLMVEHTFPADGEYELNISDIARALWVEGMEYESTLIATLDGVKFYETRIGGDEHQKAIDQRGDPAVDEINQRLKNIRFKARAGQRKVAVTFLARSFAEHEGRLTSLVPGGGEERIPKIRSIEIRGPFSVDGVSETASRKRVFTCYPQSADEEDACARQILATVGRRAYRRTITPDELDVLMASYQRARAGQSFDAGIRGGLTRILASPKFLFRSEPAPEGATPGSIVPVTDLQLASRLSFFLWSNLPDDELLDLAEQGRLQDERVLEQQIKRMLADPKASTLASNFAFQWLGLRKLEDIEPDPNIFPFAGNHRDTGADPRAEYVKEVVLFVDSIFRENRSVLELLNGKHTFLNEKVALLYGITDVKGDRFRRVELADSRRWGLLGKGGVLMVSSYPNRTAPVLRGAWILDNIVGTPPTPPPPGVEALMEPAAGQKQLSMRELMAAHSSNPSCHGCHGVLDPLGFALENFDAVGRWRDVDRWAGAEIDSRGELPDGSSVDGPDALREALLARPEQFVQTLTLKLLTYGTGRTMQYHDMPTIRAIVREAAQQDYRFLPLITTIVKSAPFRMKRIPDERGAVVTQVQP